LYVARVLKGLMGERSTRRERGVKVTEIPNNTGRSPLALCFVAAVLAVAQAAAALLVHLEGALRARRAARHVDLGRTPRLYCPGR